MVPTKEEIEEYLNALDEWVSNSLHAATSDIPSLQAIANRIWADLGRFGHPNIQLPGLGVFDVPPRPPPPPVPEPTWLERTGGWIINNRWKALGLGLCVVVGSGLLAGYATAWTRRNRTLARRRNTIKGNAERREVIVILGADCLIGGPLVSELDARGFIVIASVANSDAVEVIEENSNGFIRALVLDPNEPSAVSAFLRSLQSTLSLRFPTTSSGDPYYSSPSHHPHVCAVISLLSLQSTPAPTPLEHLSLSTTYTTYLQRSHITPLSAIQGLLPLMRISSNNGVSHKRKKKIIVCVPLVAGRIGVAWSAAEAMGAGATIKAIDVLRRELRESGQAEKVTATIVDVGSVASSAGNDINSPLGESSSYGIGAAAYMTDWSSNLRATYGPAFLGALEQSRINPRVPDDMSSVINKLVDLVDTQRHPMLGSFDWSNWGRVGVGAGVYTYAIASRLPEAILDALLSLPALLIRLRNSLIPIPPGLIGEEAEEEEEDDKPEKQANRHTSPRKNTPGSSGYSSEIDLESLSSNDRELVGSSWVSLSSKAE